MADLETRMTVARALMDACAGDPRLEALDPGDLIRHVPGKRAILHARFEGRDAVVRLCLTPDDGSPQAEWDEMLRLWPYMADGVSRIAEPLHARPETGIIVISAVHGKPLLELLWSLDPPMRRPFLPAAARWLRDATHMSEGWRVTAPGGWVRRAGNASAKQAFDVLKPYEADILAELSRLAGLIENGTWRTGITHGDYHPNNLVAYNGRLTAIDIGGSRRLPIYKDMARFLMHLGRRRVNMGGPLCLGVSRDGLIAFADAFGLEPAERALYLPFFIGFEALIRVETANLPGSRIRRAEAMYRDLVPDLQRAGPDRPLF